MSEVFDFHFNQKNSNSIEKKFSEFKNQLIEIPFEQFLRLIDSNQLFTDILFHIYK